jgi:hypothetical protein
MDQVAIGGMMLLSTMFAPYCCPNCGSKYHVLRLYCKECGCVMPQTLTGSGEVTKLFPNNQASPIDLVWGRSYFHKKAHLVLLKDASGEMVRVPFDISPAFVGRDVTRPALLFRGSEADEAGISRVHARLDRFTTTLCVTDLGSTNGTFVDGRRLSPQVACVLHNESALQFGRLLVWVKFT